MPTLSPSSAILNWETIGSGILDILWMVVKGLIVLGIGVLLIKWLMRLSTACLKRSRLSVTLHAFILSSVKVISYVFLIIIVLSVLGIPTTSLITAIGTAGVAIGRGSCQRAHRPPGRRPCGRDGRGFRARAGQTRGRCPRQGRGSGARGAEHSAHPAG